MTFRNKYRSKLRIIADILEAVNGGSKKTRIMFRANLSYKLLCKYLDEILKASLVKAGPSSSNRYFLTEKGELFLRRFRKYSMQKEEIKEKFSSIANEKETLEKMLE